MSIHALDWAFRQEIQPSSSKFVLVALCNFVSDTGKSHPSVQTICKITSLHDETARRALTDLTEQGLITDTGKKVGATQQVKVYQLPPEAWEVNVKTPEIRGLKDSDKTRTRPVQDPGFTGAEPVTSNLSTKSLKRFSVPEFSEMELYASKIGLPPTEINAFFDHHQQRGWKLKGGVPMTDWQAAMRTWKRNWEKFNRAVPVTAPELDPTDWRNSL